MKRKANKIRIVTNTTLLIVGEGIHDKAFINYLKHLYDSRDNNQKISVHSADGGSPNDILRTTMKKYKHTDFQKTYILIDSDVLINQQTRDLARRNKITLIESTPVCLEGMLLTVLGEKVRLGDTSDACKARLHHRLDGHPASKDSYSILFPKTLLDETKIAQIIELRELISNR